ncbi:MAG: hypothetical protein HPY57_13185 [Ignavibacteria bacterium]|nr:hypothetical protein [Ignavibacteria bacterium]
MTDKELIAEIAIKCNDPQFKDFPENIYVRELLRAKRKIALKYRVATRLYTFTKNNEENDNEDIRLNIPGFLGEYRVKVNKAEYHRSEDNEKLSDLTYKLEILDGDIIFNYYPRNKNDLIKIYYTATFDNEENENIQPILPPEFEEEVINYTVLEIAKLGLAKFSDPKSEGFLKYSNLIKLYGDTRLKSELLKNTQGEFIVISPRSVI